VTGENALVEELTRIIGSQRAALRLVGLSRSTWHYRRHPRPRVADPVAQKDRAYRSRIGQEDRTVIQGHIQDAWEAGVSVDHAFASTWDAGVMVASRRSWWRIAAAIADQSARPVAPTGRQAKTPRSTPVLEATGPGQVWSWDITDLRSPWRGVAYKAYSVIDIYSRKLVACRVEEREADHLAEEMFIEAFATHGIPQAVHADSGAAMRSTRIKALLAKHHITETHNRPRVSNDNPFSESEFRTMKYRPNYPGTFQDIDEARAWVDSYVPWYNQNHKHSGIALFSPNEVHDGTWRLLWQRRDQTSQAYYNTHPERFRHRPTTPAPANTVGINLPQKQQPQKQPN
jgi:transposase InsO family protein